LRARRCLSSRCATAGELGPGRSGRGQRSHDHAGSGTHRRADRPNPGSDSVSRPEEPPRLLLIGFSRGLIGHLEGWVPPGSVLQHRGHRSASHRPQTDHRRGDPLRSVGLARAGRSVAGTDPPGADRAAQRDSTRTGGDDPVRVTAWECVVGSMVSPNGQLTITQPPLRRLGWLLKPAFRLTTAGLWRAARRAYSWRCADVGRPDDVR
jgi:hypothetical protein